MLVFTQAALSFALPCAASSEAAALRRAASPKLASELPNPANTDPACALAVSAAFSYASLAAAADEAVADSSIS